MLKVNEFIGLVHENSKAHGWWETPRSDEWAIALIHSELSEALEEYRAGRPNVWYACGESESSTVCDSKDETECLNFGREKDCQFRWHKPEGIAVELIDAVIRIFDLFGYHGWTIGNKNTDIAHLVELGLHTKILEQSFPEFICSMHCGLSTAVAAEAPEKRKEFLAFTVEAVLAWVDLHDAGSAEKLLLKKHEYNKMRPYKHGKVC